jgi:hypothetical protein
VEGSLNNLKQSMVQFQKPKKVYNDRRVYPGGGGPALGPGEGFVPAAAASAATGATANDRRNGRARSVDGRNGKFSLKLAEPSTSSYAFSNMLINIIALAGLDSNLN